jgi:hypothetical protein
MKIKLKTNIAHCRNNSKIKYQNGYPNTQIHYHARYWLGTDTLIKSGGVKLVLWAQAAPLSGMTWPCKCFPYMNKQPTFTYNWAISVIIKNAVILKITYNIFNLHDTEVVRSIKESRWSQPLSKY